MNDDGEFVRELMEFGVAQLVVEGLVQEEPGEGEEGVLQLVTGLTIMKEHNVIGIRRVLAGE